MSRRVGLLGGTFDPPHLGHLVVAECLRVDLGLDEVRFLVAGQPWMKPGTTSADDRIALAQAAVADDVHLVVDDREVRREGPTYTADTLEELSGSEPDTEWWFMLGADAANALPRWERADAALELARFVVATRPGHELDLPEPYASRVELRSVPLVGVSSSELRERYRTGRATRYLVPDAVHQLIVERGLYEVAHG